MRGRVLAGVGAGVLGWWITPGLVDEVLAEARAGLAGRLGAGEELRRQRFRVLPARLGVYFVLGLCLFSDLPYGEVLRELAGGLAGALRAAGWQVPAATALTRARRRLGEKPLELLLGRLCGPLSAGAAPWSHVCGLLAVAWDGTTVKAAASGANIAAFGRPRSAKTGHYPQVRLVALIACGTRGLLGAVLGPFGKGERTLAKDLVARLGAGMLLLADRGFYGFGLWTAAAATGADLLWRVKASVLLPVIQALPDGSWLAHVNDPAAVRRRVARNGQRRRRGSTRGPDAGPLPGITVRVIEFWLTTTAGDGAARTERYRLITTLLDHQAAPAAELAAGYARRRAIETGFRECKTYLRGPGRILRSRTPDLTRQELWAYLAVYQAIRAVICLTAATAGLDPGRISFTATLHAVRRTLTTARTSPAAALADIQASILTQLVPRREDRVCVRAAIPPWWPWPSRDNVKGPHSQNATHSIAIHHPAQPPPTPASQAQQPLNRQNQPP
jgi:hypothetical protein